MDAFLLEQQIPPHKSHIGKGTKHPFIPRSNFHSTGILQTPAPLFLTHSYSVPQPPQRQPPLLPIPVSVHRHRSSSTPSNTRTRDPGKSKSSRKRKPKKPSTGATTVTLTKTSGPDRNITGNTGIRTADENQVEVFSGSMVFAISPPPSSLPFPSFLRRSKLSCNAEAASSVDTGTKDNLRRLLQLSKHAL